MKNERIIEMLDDPNHYILTDGNKYYTIDKKHNEQTATTNICEAKQYDTYERANLALKSMKKTLRITNWKIEKVEDILEKNNLDKDTVEIIVNGEDNSIVDKIKDIEAFSKELLKQRTAYEDKLMTTEKEIIDIEHAAEFYTLDAAKGYKIYKMLHNARIERRKCKDMISKISYVLDGNFQDCLSDTMSKRIEGLNHREYAPRVLKELFNA